MDTTATPSQAQVFRLAQSTRIIYGIMAPLMLLFGVIQPVMGIAQLIGAGGLASGIGWFVALIIGFLGLSGILMVLLACRLFGHTQTRLILSADGVTYDTFWESLHTDWANVARIGPTTLGAIAIDAFLLHRPATRRLRWYGFPFLRILPRAALPITGFGRAWGDDPLAAAIRRYAPQLGA